MRVGIEEGFGLQSGYQLNTTFLITIAAHDNFRLECRHTIVNWHYIAATLLRNARRVVVFTGAGISAESGIATLRDEGGFWTEVSRLRLRIKARITVHWG